MMKFYDNEKSFAAVRRVMTERMQLLAQYHFIELLITLSEWSFNKRLRGCEPNLHELLVASCIGAIYKHGVELSQQRDPRVAVRKYAIGFAAVFVKEEALARIAGDVA